MDSWWVTAQTDRETFRAAVERELPRMTADTSAAAKVDALITAQWAQGFSGRSRGPQRVPGVAWSAS